MTTGCSNKVILNWKKHKMKKENNDTLNNSLVTLVIRDCTMVCFYLELSPTEMAHIMTAPHQEHLQGDLMRMNCDLKGTKSQRRQAKKGMQSFTLLYMNTGHRIVDESWVGDILKSATRQKRTCSKKIWANDLWPLWFMIPLTLPF